MFAWTNSSGVRVPEISAPKTDSLNPLYTHVEAFSCKVIIWVHLLSLAVTHACVEVWKNIG